MSIRELKPCPFCDGIDIRITRHPGAGRGEHHGEDVYSMCCYDCGATFPNRYRRDLLVESWNRRAPMIAGGEQVPHTPAAKWRENGEPDPHGDHYNCERAALSMGDMTDDELANAVFMHGNERPSLAEMLAGKPMPIAYLTAAKERIRWLSRKLVEAQRGATTGEQQ